jgi:tetratricopeptide (TPR) repeat protein
MPESLLTRLWNSVKPPAAVPNAPLTPKDIERRGRQRKLIFGTLGVILVLGGGGGIVYYISTAPQRAEREFQVGMSNMAPGRYPAAVTHFNRAIEIKPQYPEAFLERANAHKILSDIDAALADYQTAAELNTSMIAAHNGIAMIYLERRDTRHALEELNKSLALQPGTDAYYQRGEILEAQGEHQKAIDDYTQAIAQQPDAPYMYSARATAKQNMGDEAGAKADRITAAQIMHRR